MKAVLLRTLPPERLVELVNDLPVHAVGEAAYLLRAMVRQFPPGAVHLVVVDPGVGGSRAPVAVECRDGSFLVGPDNGVLTPVAEALGVRRTVRIRPTSARQPSRVGTTFDGRDLFAPAAARLASGTPLSRLGPAHSLRPFRLPPPTRTPTGARGEVVHVDRFGNLVTNVPTDWLPRRGTWVELGGATGRRRRLPRAESYEALGRGRLGVLGSSFGTLEVAVALGRADRRLGLRAGSPVRFSWRRAPVRRVRVNSARPRHR
jgi:S-adenosylmethionine hydrolase